MQKPPDVTIVGAEDREARQAKAYHALEPYLCKVVNMGTIAAGLSEGETAADRELYDFAVYQVEEMLQDLKARYYALNYPAP
jgi:hypothetical protein